MLRGRIRGIEYIKLVGDIACLPNDKMRNRKVLNPKQIFTTQIGICMCLSLDKISI